MGDEEKDAGDPAYMCHLFRLDDEFGDVCGLRGTSHRQTVRVS